MFGSKLVVRRFDNYAKKYEARDVEEVKGRILFYGHSLFTRCAYENRWGNPSLEENVLGKDGKPYMNAYINARDVDLCGAPQKEN